MGETGLEWGVRECRGGLASTLTIESSGLYPYLPFTASTVVSGGQRSSCSSEYFSQAAGLTAVVCVLGMCVHICGAQMNMFLC